MEKQEKLVDKSNAAEVLHLALARHMCELTWLKKLFQQLKFCMVVSYDMIHFLPLHTYHNYSRFCS